MSRPVFDCFFLLGIESIQGWVQGGEGGLGFFRKVQFFSIYLRIFVFFFNPFFRLYFKVPKALLPFDLLTLLRGEQPYHSKPAVIPALADHLARAHALDALGQELAPCLSELILGGLAQDE